MVSDNHRRHLICQIKTRLDYCKDIQGYQAIMQELQEILDDEKTAFENMSEAMQGSERGQALADAQLCLEEAIDAIKGIIASIEEDDLKNAESFISDTHGLLDQFSV